MGDLLSFLKSFYCIYFFYLPLYKNNSTDNKKFICIASITNNVFFNKTKDEIHREKKTQKNTKAYNEKNDSIHRSSRLQYNIRKVKQKVKL